MMTVFVLRVGLCWRCGREHDDAGYPKCASVLADGLCGNGSEVGAGDTAMKGKQ